MARFDDIGDVSFIDGITVDELKKTAIEEYNAAYKEITGKAASITDEEKAILYTAAQIFYQLAETANEKGKQNLLKYARGDFLDNLALSKGLTRRAAEKAVVQITFNLSSARSSVIAIPAGTRVTNAAAKSFFATDEYSEIAPGETSITIQCTATEGGADKNNFAVGELNILVDPIAYVGSVTNKEQPTGGADKEKDQAFAERIFNARYEHSTAGSEKAYKYYIKSYSSLIDDVVIQNPSAANIVAYILMKNRANATEGFIAGLTEYIKDPDIKPLTDNIEIKNVERVDYTINVSYKVYSSNIATLTDIQTAVAAAVEEYKAWQCEKIGRDIDAQKLLSLLRAAGAVKITITTPEDKTVAGTQISNCTSCTLTYSGTVEE